MAARAKDGLEVDLLVSNSCLLPCDEESDLESKTTMKTYVKKTDRWPAETQTQTNDRMTNNLLLADTGQEAAVLVDGVASCVLGLVVLLVVLGLVVLLLLGVALRVAEMLVAMFVSDL